MFWLIVGAALIVAVASVVVPVLIGRSVGKTQRIPDAPVEPDNPNLVACHEFCHSWCNRRSELSIAEGDETTARGRADALRTELGIALAVVGGFLAAAVAAGTLPWPANLAVAIVALAAATIAATVAALIGGLLNAADEDLARHATASRDARIRLRDARNQIDAHCTPAEASECLSRSFP
jgi:hypothetical protein